MDFLTNECSRLCLSRRLGFIIPWETLFRFRTSYYIFPFILRIVYFLHFILKAHPNGWLQVSITWQVIVDYLTLWSACIQWWELIGIRPGVGLMLRHKRTKIVWINVNTLSYINHEDRFQCLCHWPNKNDTV